MRKRSVSRCEADLRATRSHVARRTQEVPWRVSIRSGVVEARKERTYFGLSSEKRGSRLASGFHNRGFHSSDKRPSK